MKMLGILMSAFLLLKIGSTTTVLERKFSLESDTILKEVTELHKFFEDWYNAILPKSQEAYSRFSSVMNPTARYISPTGSISIGSELISGIWQDYGKYENDTFAITIDDYKHLFLATTNQDISLVNYVEIQKIGGKVDNSRIHTSAFRYKQSTPNGVWWEHIHQTYN